MSKVTLIIGQRGSGKSTFLKERLRDLPRDRLHVYDVQAEYFPNEPLPDVKEFTHAVTQMRGNFIAFEEATIFFPNRGYDKDMVHLLVSARHRKNMIYIVYHSISAIPDYIYNLSDFMVLFKTKDKLAQVQNKNEYLLPHFTKLRERPDECLQLKLYNGNVSPYVIINL